MAKYERVPAAPRSSPPGTPKAFRNRPDWTPLKEGHVDLKTATPGKQKIPEELDHIKVGTSPLIFPASSADVTSRIEFDSPLIAPMDSRYFVAQ